MRILRVLLMVAAALLEQLHATTILASEFGLHPGSADAGPALRRILAQSPKGTIVLEPGEYHFYAESAPVHPLYVSNHDQQGNYRVGIPLIHLRNLTIKGNGSRFIFHGCMLPILVMDSSGIGLTDLDISYATPFSAEGRIVQQEGDSTTLEMHPGSQWCVEGGRFFNCGEGWKDKVEVAIAFLPDGRMVPLGKPGDIIWNCPAEQLDGSRLRFATDSRALGLTEGCVLVLRSYWRPNPAVLLYRAEATTITDVIFRNSMGMGLLAQRSTGITVRGGGCIRSEGRYGTTGADATHFSNCKGRISVRNALFEGMMDDAINVHATSLGVTRVISPTEVVVRYMHHQAIGFDVVQPGEYVQFIHGRTLENHPVRIRVKAVTRTDARTLHLELERHLPDGIGEGDALENADWHPSVDFTHNTVRHNRARGALFTTPETVLVQDNVFEWSSGSAILLAGDAQGWYESGRCCHVIIRRNLFRHCLSSLFQFTEGIISICPEVKEPESQSERYHRNILIEKNVFLTHRVPLLSAISAEGLVFRNNLIKYEEGAPELFKGEPYRIRHCERVELQPVEARPQSSTSH